MTGIFDHALAIAGFPCKPITALQRWWHLRPGARVTYVEWHGCMAHMREVTGHGRIICAGNQRDRAPHAESIEGWWVRMDDGKVEFACWTWVRVVRRAGVTGVEVWR